MKLTIVFVFSTFYACFCDVSEIKNNGVEQMYYWREVFYENLPLNDDTLIGPYPYHIPTNNDIVGVEYHVQSGLMLATVLRVRPGVPSTLNAFCAPDYDKGTSPHIWGFPDYERNTLKASFYGDSENESERESRKRNSPYFGSLREDFPIISVYRPIVDEQCSRLYALDTGVLQYSENEIYHIQSPALNIFDLPSSGCENRKFPLIRRVEIPSHLWKNPVGFIYITPDYQSKDSCDDVFLYITNAFDNSLIVYDYKNGNFWSFTDPSMRSIISESRMTFGSDFQYDFRLGIMNIALGYPDKDGNRNAYYAPGSSLAEYLVSTKLLKNRKRSSNNFRLIAYRGCDSQVFRQVLDLPTGVMFFAEMKSKRVRCWNVKMPLNPDTIGTVFESNALEYLSDIYIDSNDYLWFHSSHLPIDFFSNIPLTTTEINSRTFRVKISEAIKGTVCDFKLN